MGTGVFAVPRLVYRKLGEKVETSRLVHASIALFAKVGVLYLPAVAHGFLVACSLVCSGPLFTCGHLGAITTTNQRV